MNRRAAARSGGRYGLTYTGDELKAIGAGPRPPFLMTRHWASLLDGRTDDPLRRQAVPTTAESVRGPGELNDPLNELSHSPLPGLIRRYPDRALVVMTSRCALYCRHCFRRRITGGNDDITPERIAAIAGWLALNPEVGELLLSGGDPLMLPRRTLLSAIDGFRSARPDIVLRLATRVPVVDPDRITRSLARSIGRRRPLWVVIQINHSREITPPFLRALRRLQERGLPVVSQSVLLRGVNDDADVLAGLFRSLVKAGVKPYYLFQGDLAEGTSHFRLPLAGARRLVEEVRARVSGLAMPVFAVDLPDGGGKVPLGFDYVGGPVGGVWTLTAPGGRTGRYTDPPEGNGT